MKSLSDLRCGVIILNWNGAQQLCRFLPSVVAHTPEWVDVVVADNGSTDSSEEVIKQQFSERVKWLPLGANYGFAEGYNRALAALNYDIFILLNSDVEVSEGWCEPLVEALHNDKKLGAVGSKLRSVERRGEFEYAGASGGFIDYFGYPFCRGRVLFNVEEDRGQYNDEREVFWVSGAAFACRAEVFRSLGGFDADYFAHFEEIDLCWRMQLAGYTIRIIPRSIVYHLGGATLSSESPLKTKLNHRNNLAMIFKCAPTPQRIVCAVVRPFLDGVAALSYLLKGRWRSAWAVAEAWWQFIGWHKSLSSKRVATRRNRKAESTQIYRGSILLAAIFGKTPRM